MFSIFVEGLRAILATKVSTAHLLNIFDGFPFTVEGSDWLVSHGIGPEEMRDHCLLGKSFGKTFQHLLPVSVSVSLELEGALSNHLPAPC